ncbi:hypothetical protein, partial [Prevotella pectinovora]|uniref:hypothetical protein n=1 Tax=Prevotella pectinovora TaxID=1602169 RepID=UPI00307AE5FF
KLVGQLYEKLVGLNLLITEVCKDMQHIDLPHLYNSSINGHGACPTGARCLPMWGTVLAPSGHNQYPKCAQSVSKTKRQKRG